MKRKLIVSALVTLAGIAVIFIAFSYTGSQVAKFNNQPLPKRQPSPPPAVTYLDVTPDNYPAKIKAFGEAHTRFNLTLSSRVGGRIATVSNDFRSGTRVSKGTELATIESSDYAEAVANARQQVAAARVSLLEAEREAVQARIEWKKSGLTGKPSSELVLHKPQVAQAKAELASARATLKAAQKDLEATHLRAPFDALVVSRAISPGSYISPGGEVGTLYSTNAIEVELPLTSKQWNWLGNAVSRQANVMLTDVESGQKWLAYAARDDNRIDSESRQRSLIAVLENPYGRPDPLLPGTFVKAVISGRDYANLLKVPASSLSQRGLIWYINGEDQLESFTPDIEFEGDDYLYVKPPVQTTIRIVPQPLSSYLNGQKVTPVKDSVTDEDDDGAKSNHG